MNIVATILLGVVAAVATGLAVAAGTNASLAIPAATAAVAAGALFLVGVVEQTRWPSGRPLPTVPVDPARVRSSLAAGPRGRPALVYLLDNLERSGGTMNVPVPSDAELRHLAQLSREEFRQYLTDRVNDLEGRT